MKTDHALIWMSVAYAEARALQRESATVRATYLTNAVCAEAAAFLKKIAIARAMFWTNAANAADKESQKVHVTATGTCLMHWASVGAIV